MTDLGEIPQVLQMPDKLAPILANLSNYRYFLAEGGRGGGKTQAIARILAYVGEKRKVRIFCGRETQNTIDESVYTVFKDVITDHNLNYAVYHDKIVHRTTGSQIRFKGFRETGNVNIKGMEGVDILWIDEAQAITKNTLDIIVPTIRKENAIVIFTMNRHLEADPVFAKFAKRADCLHININYDDNPFLSEALKKEAEDCRINEPDDYQHIWKGEPLSQADNYLFNRDALNATLTREFPHDADKYQGAVIGCDVARFGDNYSAGLVLEQCGPDHWAESFLDRWKKHDIPYTAGKFTEMGMEHHPDYIVVDGDGLGGGVVDIMRENRTPVVEFHGGHVDGIPGNANKKGKEEKKKYKNWRTYGYLLLNDMVNAGKIRIRSKLIVDQLKEIKYRYDNTGRKYIIRKEEMIEAARKKSIKFNSPDDADALMMAVTQVEIIKNEQATMYTARHQRTRSQRNQAYAYEDNLLE